MFRMRKNRPTNGRGAGLCESVTEQVRLNFDAAYRLGRKRFSVFPCQPDGEQSKAPLRGLPWKSASTADAIEIVRLWVRQPGAAPAIDCGKSGLVVLDCDAKHGKQGVMAWARLITQHEPVFAPVVLTPSGGLHVYFRQLPNGPEIGCSRGDFHQDIDVRGVGGYVLAPGAVTAQGSYALIAGNLDDIPEVPDWLVTWLKPWRDERGGSTPPPATSPLPGDLARVEEALRDIPADDYDTWIRVGMALKGRFGEAGRPLWDRWSATSDKYHPRVQARKWASFKRSGVRINTIFWLAEQYRGRGARC